MSDCFVTSTVNNPECVKLDQRWYKDSLDHFQERLTPS